MSTQPEPPVILIEWIDAFISTSDFSKANAEKTKGVRRYTVGFFVAETDQGVVLATDFYEKKKDGFAGKLFVPWGCIEKYEQFEQVK